MHTLGDVLAAADEARAVGPETVLVTSAVFDTSAPGTLDMVAVSSAGAWRVTTPLLSGVFQGAGDLTSAVFLARLLQSGDLAEALGRTAAVVYGVLAATARSGRRELQLVSAQDELVRPTNSFDVTRLR